MNCSSGCRTARSSARRSGSSAATRPPRYCGRIAGFGHIMVDCWAPAVDEFAGRLGLVVKAAPAWTWFIRLPTAGGAPPATPPPGGRRRYRLTLFTGGPRYRKTTLFKHFGELQQVVGAAGFKPATSCAQGRRAIKLRYAPTRNDGKDLSPNPAAAQSESCPQRSCVHGRRRLSTACRKSSGHGAMISTGLCVNGCSNRSRSACRPSRGMGPGRPLP